MRSTAFARVAGKLVPLALAFAFVLSSQYLFQPFVWRHWPIDVVLMGWLEILRDRMLVAASLASALAVVMASPLRPGWGRNRRAGAAVAMGAAGGELLLHALDVPGASTSLLVGAERVLRWSVFTAGLVLLWLAWSRALAAEAAARENVQAKASAERQLNALQMQALQAQLEPHFLFNTLATDRKSVV